jgi:ABC-type multidrug transport system fused ATPase/permease subunit
VRTLPEPETAEPDHRTPGRYLWWLALLHRGPVLLAAAYGVACMLAQALIPVAVGAAIDDGLIGRDRGSLLLWAGAVLGLGVVQAATSIMRDRASLTVSLGAGYRTMDAVTRQASWLGATLTRRVSNGEAVAAGVTDASQIGRALESTAQGCGSVAAIVAVATVMLTVSWPLALAVLSGVPLMVWAITAMARPMHRRQNELRTQQGELTARAVDIASGLRVLRGAGGEDAFATRYREESQRVRHAAVRVARVDSLLGGARELLPGLLMALTVWLGAQFVISGRISTGDLVVFYAYAVFLANPMRRLTSTVNLMIKGHVAARRVTDLLALSPDIPDGDRPGTTPGGELSDPDSGLRVRPGVLTAVVCPKETDAAALADRLGRYVDSDVSLGGVPLRELPREEVRRTILVVPNEALLFSGPLRSVLAPANHHGTDEPLWRALDTASARDIADALPDGLDAMISGAGRELSGGQRQRLRLARALLADPPVLILVEPTSAVDAHTEGLIARRLRAHRAERTTVVFTHSPLVLDQADHVVFLAGGTTVGEGSHAQLLTDDHYRQLITREDTDAA